MVELTVAANDPRTTSPAVFVPDSESLKISRPEFDARERRRRFWVFFDWCVQHEAYSKRTYLLVLVPLLVAGITFQVILQLGFYPSMISRYLFQSLGWVCAFSLFALGIRHAARAVCWELSVELRELVRLTGIEPSTLLWTQSASRWLTIAISLILMTPLFAYTRTLGGINSDRWIAAGFGLLLVAVLTAAFAMLASVSSSSAKNADTTAANATVALGALYHAIFWGIGMFFWFHGFARINGVAHFWFELAPITQVYRSFAAPELFSPLEPGYWIHFLTAMVGMGMATVVMRNRFHSESIESDPSKKLDSESTAGAMAPALHRPRCSERPFLWKDTYILGGSAFSNAVWLFISVSALIGTLFAIAASVLYENPAALIVAILLIGAAPWIVAMQFDSLMVAEFRERTWGSLMLLPVHWLDPIVSKIQAALWERRWMFPPMIIAAIYAAYRAPFPILIAVMIASLALLILIEVSVLSHFNAKKWWAGLIVGMLVLILIAALVAVWVIFSPEISLTISVVGMSATIAGFLVHIRWRIHNWTGD